MNKSDIHTYIPTLNGWRAFSIIYVLIFHGTWFFFNPKTGIYPNEELWMIIKNGAFGVSFFFGISGYLITTRLIEEHLHYGKISLKAFYWRRFFRIIPILLAFLSVILLLKGLGKIAISKTAIWSSLFFFRNYVEDHSGWFTAHFWSLSMEEHYYLIWPMLFIFFVKLKRPWIPILGILLTVTAWRMLEYRYHILSPHLAITELRGRTDLFFDYMMWGSLAAFLNMNNRFKNLFYHYAKPWMLYFVLFFIHVLFFIKIPLMDTIKGILIQACLLLTINFSKTSFSNFLENKWISRIGIYSYSLYVWQQLFLIPANERVEGLFFFQTPPVNIIFLIIIAYLSYNYFENPALKFGKKFLAKKGLAR